MAFDNLSFCPCVACHFAVPVAYALRATHWCHQLITATGLHVAMWPATGALEPKDPGEALTHGAPCVNSHE